MERRKSSLLLTNKTPDWNETVERFAVAITQLHHSRFSNYKWCHLKNLFESCNVRLFTIIFFYAIHFISFFIHHNIYFFEKLKNSISSYRFFMIE